jgi:phosphate transport system permease protein
VSVAFLVFFISTIFAQGYPAFFRTEVLLDIDFDAGLINPGGTDNPADLLRADYSRLTRNALYEKFPAVSGRSDRRALRGLVSNGATFLLRDMVQDNPQLVGTRQSIWLTADDEVDLYVESDRAAPPVSSRRFGERHVAWIEQLEAEGRIRRAFNSTFFTQGDSRDPEMAGIWGALKGSFFTLLVTMLVSFPLGVFAAIYLEEFAPRNRWTDMIEVNINNLAAVPSIIFGLLGLAVFINFMELPRSAPLVGGLVLSLMTMPVIIIAARASISAVPPSVREAALGLGASPVQMVLHHVLPLAMPGMLTGAIIGMSRALGESAPLLMIGMVAFIVDPPAGLLSPATALPIQVFLWADSPERAFAELTSAAIIVLLIFLLLMNGGAILLRRRFERRW